MLNLRTKQFTQVNCRNDEFKRERRAIESRCQIAYLPCSRLVTRREQNLKTVADMEKAKRKMWPYCHDITIRNRTFSQEEVVRIRELIRRNKSWGRTRLSEKVCEEFDWRQDNGRLKDRACRVALLRLEALGYLELPTRKVNTGGQPPKKHPNIDFTASRITELVDDLQVLQVKKNRSPIWNSCISQFHYLGLPTPVGRTLRYLVFSGNELLSAISFGEPAWHVASRNKILGRIGFDDDDIMRRVISNNRFLILPHVNVANLASQILSRAVKHAVSDWEKRYAVLPRIVETFVDPQRYLGTCYKASNWIQIGNTKGFSKRGASHCKTSGPKMVFLRATEKVLQRKLAEARLIYGEEETRSIAVVGERSPRRLAG